MEILGPCNDEVWAQDGANLLFLFPLDRYIDENGKAWRIAKKIKPIDKKRLAVKAWNRLVKDGIIKQVNGRYKITSEYMIGIALDQNLGLIYFYTDNGRLILSKSPIL